MTSDFCTVIVATGCSIPARCVPNEEFLGHRLFESYGKPFDPADNPKIISKFREITGILERHYVAEDQVASDLAIEAAANALAGGGIDPETLDYLIVAHNFGDVLRSEPALRLRAEPGRKGQASASDREPGLRRLRPALRLSGMAAGGHPGGLLPPVR